MKKQARLSCVKTEFSTCLAYWSAGQRFRGLTPAQTQEPESPRVGSIVASTQTVPIPHAGVQTTAQGSCASCLECGVLGLPRGVRLCAHLAGAGYPARTNDSELVGCQMVRCTRVTSDAHGRPAAVPAGQASPSGPGPGGPRLGSREEPREAGHIAQRLAVPSNSGTSLHVLGLPELPVPLLAAELAPKARGPRSLASDKPPGGQGARTCS